MHPSKDSVELPRLPAKAHYARNSLRSRIARARGHILHKTYTSVPQSDASSSIQIGMNEALDSFLNPAKMPDSPVFDSPKSPGSQSSSSLNEGNMDGSSSDKRSAWARHSHPPVGAIFVHAGAGYHSTTNEHIHLGACAE